MEALGSVERVSGFQEWSFRGQEGCKRPIRTILIWEEEEGHQASSDNRSSSFSHLYLLTLSDSS
jgi:hypothetical protein